MNFAATSTFCRCGYRLCIHERGVSKTEPASRSARLAPQLAPDTLNLAKCAAEIEGRSLSDFVATAMQEAARRTFERTHIIRLSLEGQQHFAELMIDPPEPSPGLLRAFEGHRRLIGEP